MSLSNTATPKYYGMFREAVVRGEIPVCETIAMEMNRIDDLIRNPGAYYDDEAVEGWIRFCENELTLTDGSDMKLLDSFKLWGEQVFGWYYYIKRQVYVPNDNGHGGHYEIREIKKRLTKKQYLIVGRGAAKSLYSTTIHGYYLTVDPETTDQITTAPTMKMAEEVVMPLVTAIARSRGPLFKFLTEGSLQNTTGSKANRQKLASTKKGVQNFLTNSILEIKPMTIDKLQGLKTKVATVDEWLSGDTKEDVVSAIEQGSSKLDDYIIILTSSEGTVRNGPGDTIKMELMDILKGKYPNPYTSIWYYKLDSIDEVGNSEMWIKANPNLGKTVQYEAYQLDVVRMEHAPQTRNDILAKRFGIPMEGYTYFFTYQETLPTSRQLSFWQLPCTLGADLSQGGDFCAFTFLFPLQNDTFGLESINFISEYTLNRLPLAMRQKYEEFIAEGSLRVMPGTVLEPLDIYDEVLQLIDKRQYDVQAFGYDPYNADTFVQRWIMEHSPYGVEKVIQGARTETVPLTEMKKLAEQRELLFNQKIITYTMGNCIVLEDTNGNKKLYKKAYEDKIDTVSAAMDAYVAYKLHKELFE